MTIHLGENYQCPECDERYIPFNEDQLPCPRCQHPAEEVMDLIPLIVSAARYNRTWPFALISVADFYVAQATQLLATVDLIEIEFPEEEESLDTLCTALTLQFLGGDQHRTPHTQAFVKAVLQEAYPKEK